MSGPTHAQIDAVPQANAERETRHWALLPESTQNLYRLHAELDLKVAWPLVRDQVIAEAANHIPEECDDSKCGICICVAGYVHRTGAPR